MLRLAIRNLFQSRARLVITAGGVALSLLLILTLDAIFQGVEKQVSAYIDQSGADVFVAQEGVRNMHMASSSLPATALGQVEAIPGVGSVTPILYVTNVVSVGDSRNVAYVIGLPGGAQAGGPARVVAGREVPGPGEAIIDRSIADKADVGLGGEVKILGRKFTVTGLSTGTVNLVSSVAFISMEDFRQARAGSDAVSFLLVRARDGVQPADLAARIEAQVSGVTAQPTSTFAAQERRVIRDMSTDLLAIMNLIGLLIGLAVMALTTYTASLGRRAEYGVLKALGARNADLRLTVVFQAMLSVALGFTAGLAMTLLLAAVVPLTGVNLLLQVTATSLLKVGAISLVIAGVSAVLPVVQIGRLDPAQVFRGGSTR
jgi:putative ABC transport system permease protein